MKLQNTFARHRLAHCDSHRPAAGRSPVYYGQDIARQAASPPSRSQRRQVPVKVHPLASSAACAGASRTAGASRNERDDPAQLNPKGIPMNLRRLFAILLACFFVFPPVAGAQSSLELPNSFDLPAIDGYISAYVKSKGLVGLSVAIMRNGDMVFAKGYGRRSIDPDQPVEPDTSFAVGSITKQFVCACVFLLQEEGKLTVTEPLATYFPHLTRAADITLLDLMSHTSGFPDYYPLDFVDRRMARPISLDNLLRDYACGKLDFEPGSQFSYSNTGYIILGGIIEKVSGEKPGDFLQRRVLSPLGMKHSKFASPSEPGNAATGYTGFALSPPEPATPEAAGWIETAGGLWATAADLLRWDLALVTGKVIGPASFDRMIAPRYLTSGHVSHYGCGLNVENQAGETILKHTGGVSGFVSFNAVLPRTKSGLVVLSNTEHISATALRNDLLELVLKDIAKQNSSVVPKVAGPQPKEAVLRFFHELQSGTVDRSVLGEEFSTYLTEQRIQAARQRLKELGEVEAVEAEAPAERGGMEVVRVRLTFKASAMRASLYRSADGKIQQLLFYAE
jgi:CubicO group peptidase (beta-lactamase class C family)